MKKWFGMAAALTLLVMAAGCASQAGSQPSTVEARPTVAAPSVAAPSVAAPSVAGAVTESPLASPAATDAVTSTETVTATETATVEMPEQAAAVQRWPVLWDPEIGFEVRYPQGWLVSELETTDKDAPVTRVYALQPADWAEDYAPILVEVSEGSATDFRKAYIEPSATETRNIGPLAYAYETAGSEGSLEHFAVFTSPDNPDLRVVVRDTVTGFPARASAHADLAALIGQVTESFRWRK